MFIISRPQRSQWEHTKDRKVHNIITPGPSQTYDFLIKAWSCQSQGEILRRNFISAVTLKVWKHLMSARVGDWLYKEQRNPFRNGENPTLWSIWANDFEFYASLLKVVMQGIRVQYHKEYHWQTIWLPWLPGLLLEL